MVRKQPRPLIEVVRRIAIILAGLALVGSAGARAGAPQIVPVGVWANPLQSDTHAVAISGHYACLSSSLEMLDISNPANPVLVGRGASTGVAMVSSGSYGYLVNSLDFEVIDLSNPTNPVRVGQADLSDGTGLEFRGTTLM
jgi:hypothetical protein